MMELKQEKNILNKILRKQVFVTFVTLFIVVFVLMGTSYAVLGSDDETDKATVNIKVGSMQVVLSTNGEQYTLGDKLQYPVSDAVGITQTPYSFSLTNVGNNDIGYFEIRMVDQENKRSTLSHKYIRYVLKANDSEYTSPVNLGDVDSIIYSGYNLKKGDIINFDLKMWIDEEATSFVYNKELYGALEVTLHQKYDVYDYYVLYDSVGGMNHPFRTNIQEPISTIIPKKENYIFLGWSSSENGSVTYTPGASYKENVGRTLYAVWKKVDWYKNIL